MGASGSIANRGFQVDFHAQKEVPSGELAKILKDAAIKKP
jgi:predicted RNA binding protein YcfA (HicA-like mRNA interferase family)